MIVLALLLQISAVPAPRITHDTLGAGHYRLSVVAPRISRVEEMQRLLLPTAQRLCDELRPHFGRFEWRNDEEMMNSAGQRAAPRLTFVQDLLCGTPPSGGGSGGASSNKET